VSSTDAAVVYSLEPVAGALIAWVVLGERWGPMGWAGGALILAASLATQAAGATDGANPDDAERDAGGGA
jgi:drug/metabolite transporter (DMT)-like permease